MVFMNRKKTGGIMDEIRCDESSYLIWKWHPSGIEKGAGDRENAIRFGSSLRVKDGEVAVFVYKQKDGTMQDFIVGPFDQKIVTANFPVLASIIGLAYEGGTPFQAEVYYINLAQIIQIKFGVPFFDVYDPRFVDFGVPVAVRGTISFNIKDYKEFIKLHRLNTFKLEDFKKQICDAVTRYAKNVITNVPEANHIPLIQIERKTSEVNDILEKNISGRLENDFGVVVSGVDIGAIELDKSNEGYTQLMAVTKDVTTATIQAKTEANVKNIHDMQRIEAENYEESLRVQREEGQYAVHKKTQTSNFAAYQTEAQAQVGVAGAEALGKMGENGAGGVDLEGSGAGFNPVAMMAGMAVGGAIGQNIAGTMNNMMPGTNGGMVQGVTQGIVPPPIITKTYHVVVNGQATGPFDKSTLSQMVSTGQLGEESLVWMNGMSNWEKASAVDDLKELFRITPPIPAGE